MSAHDYTPRQALNTFLDKIRERDAALASEIQDAINAGKDILEFQENRRGRQKQRRYRKTIQLTEKEALKVALQVLQTHFIEVPLFINSSAAEFQHATTGHSKTPRFFSEEGITLQGEGEGKILQVELQTEMQLTPVDQELLMLKPRPPEMIREQERAIRHLEDLLDFTEGNNRNAR